MRVSLLDTQDQFWKRATDLRTGPMSDWAWEHGERDERNRARR
jgi:hypothetical protein